MRVISGYLKGRKVGGYNTPGTRPTMDRVKESIKDNTYNRNSQTWEGKLGKTYY